MSLACGDGGSPRRRFAALTATEGLALAATPTFAVMAVLSIAVGDAPAQLLCSGGPGSLLSGMTTMYLLMGGFHAAPWLTLIRQRRGPRATSGPS
jgi:hypothetical protein